MFRTYTILHIPYRLSNARSRDTMYDIPAAEVFRVYLFEETVFTEWRCRDGGQGHAHLFRNYSYGKKYDSFLRFFFLFRTHFKFKRHRPNLMTLVKLAATLFIQYRITDGDSKKSLVMRLYFRKDRCIYVRTSTFNCFIIRRVKLESPGLFSISK